MQNFIWKRRALLAGAVFAAVWLVGCVSKAEPEFRPMPPESEQVRTRSAALADVWGKDAVRAVLLSEQDLQYYRQDTAGLLARLQALKVNFVYLAAETPDALTSRAGRNVLADMITRLSEAGIASNIVLPQHVFPDVRSATVFHRMFRGSTTLFDDSLRYAVGMKKYLPESVPAPGVTVWAGLHRMTENNEKMPAGAIYRWSESNYGPESDNDQIMKQFLTDLALWREIARAEKVSFSVAIPAFYHRKARQGELSKGTVKDFLTVADSLLVIGSGEKPSTYLQSLQEVLREDASGRIRCGMVLSEHGSETSGALRRRSWQDFFRILSVMHQRCGSMAGYGGMVLIPWQSVELLQER